MGLRVFNTMGREMQDFVPITPGFVGFYGCGPTVYNYAHIGNLRAYVFLDILDRTLSYLGYDKKHVMNITDIGHLTGDDDSGEDKIVKTAKERHQSVLEVAQFYTDVFFKDLDALNIRRPDVVCKATDHVSDMIELIKRIEANGHTYMPITESSQTSASTIKRQERGSASMKTNAIPTISYCGLQNRNLKIRRCRGKAPGEKAIPAGTSSARR